MDGYAGFVWTAYGLSAAALTALGWFSHRRMKRMEAAAEGLRRRPAAAQSAPVATAVRETAAPESVS